MDRMDTGTRLEAGTGRRDMASAAMIRVVIALGDKPGQSLHSVVIVILTRLTFVQPAHDMGNGARIVPVQRN